MRVVSVERGTRGAVKIGLDSGSFFLCRLAYFPEGSLREAAGWEALAAESAPLLGERELALLAAAAEAFAAEREALKKLALRERSRLELELALKRKKHGAAAVKAALDLLESEGLLSERRFADAYLRSRLRSRPEGEALLRARLSSKGLSRDAATEAVKERAEDIASGLERAAAKALRREEARVARKGRAAALLEPVDSPSDPRSEILSAVYKRLRALGYGRNDVLSALRKLGQQTGGIDESDDST